MLGASIVTALATDAGDGTCSPSTHTLLWTPCDPGECHIYFSQQRKALATAVGLARTLKRTLVLPPFEWYDGQAQLMANAFRATADGRRPRFTAWSDLFDLTQLRQRVPLIELHELRADAADSAAALRWDRAIYAKGTLVSANERKLADVAAPPLTGVLAESGPCKPRSSAGLLMNLTSSADLGGGGPWAGELMGGAMSVQEVRCGALLLTTGGGLQLEKATAALASWFGDAPSAAIFSVGHYSHAKAWSSAEELDATYTPPAASLEAEARRFVVEVLLVGSGSGGGGGSSGGSSSGGKFVAMHWRDGDYVPYKLGTSASGVAERAKTALAELGCASCAVFIMTNCREKASLAELQSLLPTATIGYTPPADAPPGSTFGEEGPRLVIEQAIATLADAFVGSGRSAVTHFVEEARRHAARHRAWQSDEAYRNR